MNETLRIGEKANRRYVLWAATASQLMTAFTGSAVTVAVPTMGQELGLNAMLLSWVLMAYLVAAAMFLIPFGRLADIHGRQPVFLGGALVFTGATIVLIVTPSPEILIACRVVQGIGAAMLNSTAMALVTAVYPRQGRGLAMGWVSGSAYIGLSCGPFVGGFLTTTVGWRGLFALIAPLGLLLVMLAATRLRSQISETKSEPFDGVGAALYSIPLMLVLFGITLLPSLAGLLVAALGALGLLTFVIREENVPNPLLHISLFKHNRAFAVANLATFVSYSSIWAISYLLSLYLQSIKGLSAWDTGIVMVSQPVLQAIGSPFAGRLSDRIEPHLVASLGMGMAFIGLVLLALLDTGTSTLYLFGALLVCGLGFGLFAAPNANAVMSTAPHRSLGLASAILNTMRVTGQATSMGVATMLIVLFAGVVQLTPEHHPTFLQAAKTAFSIFAALCLVAIGASLFGRKSSKITAPQTNGRE